jgi:hypothetical protein
MTWYAGHIYASPKAEVIAALSSVNELRGHLYQVDRMPDFECYAAGIPVVMCPHDEYMAEFHAANFDGFVSRTILDYAINCYEDDGEMSRETFDGWLEKLSSFLSPAWTEQIKEIARREARTSEIVMPNGRAEPWTGLLHPSENDDIVRRDLDFPDLGQKFKWMK